MSFFKQDFPTTMSYDQHRLRNAQAKQARFAQARADLAAGEMARRSRLASLSDTALAQVQQLERQFAMPSAVK